ncbi:hypothetical protein ACSQ67_017532 [Phaseolus vulgaris]
MGVDLRQVVAGVLTLTMFVMLIHMIKRDHFDAVDDKLPGTEDISFESTNFETTHVRKNIGIWKGDVDELKPCWVKPSEDSSFEQTEGFVTFSLTNGPEYHISQIADAVLVARSLGATLVIPDIRGSQPGDKRNFEDIYDVDVFMKSMEAVVRVIKGECKACHLFSFNKHEEGREKSDADSVACLAMYGSLELQQETHDLVNSMVERLKTLSRKSDGQFVAVDLRVEMLDKKGCQGSDGDKEKSCFNPQEVAVFLRKIGFDRDTTIYVTQSRWDESLDSLKDLFPKTYTKESIIPADKKKKFLDSKDSELEKVIDFYISSESNVFVPAISGLFYANVAGKRIGSGKSQILVPANIPDSSASASRFLSHYVSKKNHFAYSCYC